MTALLWIRFFVGITLLLCGIVVFGIELFGVFRFGYVLNRMHAAALGDTLGIALSMGGLIVLCGLNFIALKMILVVIFLWFASPVSSHMLARFEVATNEELIKECDVEALSEESRTGGNKGMQVFQIVLFLFLIVCAISVSFSRNLLNSIIIFMSYSLIMSIIWILLESPDLAITEAAVGAGITSILFFVTLKKSMRLWRLIRTKKML